MLVEGGADNVNQCFLEASRFGSTELVRVLLHVSLPLILLLLDRAGQNIEPEKPNQFREPDPNQTKILWYLKIFELKLYF